MRFPDVSRLGAASIEGRPFTVYLVADDWDSDSDDHASDHARGQCECPCRDVVSALDDALRAQKGADE